MGCTIMKSAFNINDAWEQSVIYHVLDLFLRFYFTAERLQTVLIECDYWSKLFVATVAVFLLKPG